MTSASDSVDETLGNSALLHRIWMAQTRALLAILENTNPSDIPAAVLTVVRQFLSDNRIDADSIQRMKGELDKLRRYEGAPFDRMPFKEGDGSGDFQ